MLLDLTGRLRVIVRRMVRNRVLLRARVVEGHELATTGPYAWVRHPNYTGMLIPWIY
jgi:protein-S-isoprenylcysteine O-methyltransferase Ste14